ncbi:MAG: AAA family ATPase [Pirellulaceae bacterium]
MNTTHDRLANSHTPDLELGVADLIAALSNPNAYPQDPTSTIEQLDTHISLVFLTDNFAYKVKKCLRNSFLDYSSLEQRRHYCFEELRLDRRYAPDLYLDVVPIAYDGQTVQVEGAGPVIEYAVKMRRFDGQQLLNACLQRDTVSDADIQALATTLATFHTTAQQAGVNVPYGTPASIYQDAIDNFDALEEAPVSLGLSERLGELRQWTEREYLGLAPVLAQRKTLGAIRECHGDLHTGNLVRWRQHWTPFDGIEFNERFRFIDVMSDAGFLGMDLIAKHHSRLSNLFINCYLEETGDYAALQVLRWYMVYRALVRAKVALMRFMQAGSDVELATVTSAELKHLLATAQRIARNRTRRLWITHGPSGSGKSTGALRWVQDVGAIRIRSDVERKRLLGQQATYRPLDSQLSQVYSTEMTHDVYRRLADLASSVLKAGYSPIVDATFLEKKHRDAFVELAAAHAVEMQILDFQAPESVLRARIESRIAIGTDASDAGLTVLEHQLKSAEPLCEQELAIAVSVSAGLCL